MQQNLWLRDTLLMELVTKTEVEEEISGESEGRRKHSFVQVEKEMGKDGRMARISDTQTDGSVKIGNNEYQTA
jgi:hypothetical protein